MCECVMTVRVPPQVCLRGSDHQLLHGHDVIPRVSRLAAANSIPCCRARLASALRHSSPLRLPRAPPQRPPCLTHLSIAARSAPLHPSACASGVKWACGPLAAGQPPMRAVTALFLRILCTRILLPRTLPRLYIMGSGATAAGGPPAWSLGGNGLFALELALYCGVAVVSADSATAAIISTEPLLTHTPALRIAATLVMAYR